MPDMWSHLIGGKLAAEVMTDEKWQQIIRKHINLFYFGCQAPDMFYYYNFQPWKRDKIGNLVSAAIHGERCRDFAVSLVNGIDPASESYESDVVFVLGFFCHWVMDRVAHPYIHYISGVGSRLKASSVRSATAHKRIELLIDVLLAEQYLDVEPYQESLIDRISVGPELPPSVVNMLKGAIAFIYPTIWVAQREDIVESCYKDMLTSLSWLYDPKGHKKRFFWGVLDKVFGISSLTYFYPKTVGRKVDYLNESRREWCHPACETEVSTESFQNLLDRSVRESSELMEATISYLEGRLGHEQWVSTLGNLSYSTGKNSATPAELMYSDPLPVL